jgi:hypothetical protein
VWGLLSLLGLTCWSNFAEVVCMTCPLLNTIIH